MFDIKYLGTFLLLFSFLFFLFKHILKNFSFINNKTFFYILYIDEVISVILSFIVLITVFNWD